MATPTRAGLSPARAHARRSERDKWVSTNGATANFMFFGRGTFWVLPLTYFYLPKSARAYLFTNPSNNKYFCSDPISVEPICPQPRRARCAGLRSRTRRLNSHDFKADFKFASMLKSTLMSWTTILSVWKSLHWWLNASSDAGRPLRQWSAIRSVFMISNRKISNWASQILKANMLPISLYCLKFQIARV